MRVGVTRQGLRVYDRDEVVFEVGTEDWESTRTTTTFSRAVDATIAGRTTRVSFPPGQVSVAPPRCDGGELVASGTARSVGADRPPLRIDSALTVFLSVDGEATVENTPQGVDVPFDSPTAVTIGFRRPRDDRNQTLRIPSSPAAVAEALTRLGAHEETTSPARSDPTRRCVIPPIEHGSTLDIPATISTDRPDTAIEVRVPDRLEDVYVLAPLAFYLRARMRTEDRNTAVISSPSLDRELALPGPPRLQARVASLLYRTLFLDSLARTAAPAESSCRATALLAAVGLDPTELRARDLADRFATYLEAPFDRIEPQLPEWHLSMYLGPEPENVCALSQVLDRLAFVYLPESRTLELEDRLQRSLEDFYRSGTDAPTVDPILPDLHRGRIHGWMADGVPIDAFTYLPAAYEHRHATPAVHRADRRLTVVVNDEEMAEEASHLERLYGDGGIPSDITLTVRRQLDRDSLAELLGEPATVFHYVGHCDSAGLRCTDGNLSIADVAHCGARTFFLNACGSFHEGAALVRQGAIAGAVTLRPVLDEQATRVGTAFTQLLLAGFAVERALRIACRRAIMNKDYVVVGDGSYSITEGETGGDIVHLTAQGDRFHLEVESGSATSIDGALHATLGTSASVAGLLDGDPMTRAEVATVLDRHSLPVIFRNRFFWGTELARQLRNGNLDI